MTTRNMTTQGTSRNGGPATLHIDWTRCDGRGLCTELLPDLLVRDDWGYPLAAGRPAKEQSNVPLGREDLPAAADAVALCPRLALSLRRR